MDLFSGLSRRDRQRIARSGREVDHEPSKEIVTQGRSGIAFHLVLGGSADVEIGGRTRRRLGAGDYFGEISLLDGKPRTATVRAGSDGFADVRHHRLGIQIDDQGTAAGCAGPTGPFVREDS